MRDIAVGWCRWRASGALPGPAEGAAHGGTVWLSFTIVACSTSPARVSQRGQLTTSANTRHAAAPAAAPRALRCTHSRGTSNCPLQHVREHREARVVVTANVDQAPSGALACADYGSPGYAPASSRPGGRNSMRPRCHPPASMRSASRPWMNSFSSARARARAGSPDECPRGTASAACHVRPGHRCLPAW